jgi:hypothetical protein
MGIPKKVNVSNILVLEEPPSIRFIPLPTLVESGKVASYVATAKGNSLDNIQQTLLSMMPQYNFKLHLK